MTRRMLFLAILAIMVFMLVIPRTAAAQGVGGIGGTVIDESGAALPGVAVALSNPGRDRRRSADRRPTSAARISSRAWCPGHLRRQGRRCRDSGRAMQERIVVNSDTTARVDLHLEIGALEETHHRLRPVAAARHHADAQADRHDARDAGRAAVAQRRLGHRADGAGRRHEQVRRRRIGDVLAVLRARSTAAPTTSGPTRSTAWT